MLRATILFLISLTQISSAFAQQIDIIKAEESSGNIIFHLETDMDVPFEVMASINLAGQKDEDVWIGNSQRIAVKSKSQSFSIPAVQKGTPLPNGDYICEVNFYPRWGAKNSPQATKSITKEVQGTLAIKLNGSKTSAADVAKRNDLQRWVMLNTHMGQKFSLSSFEKKLGRSEQFTVTNRNGIIVGHYFPIADMSIYENTLKGTLVTWKIGKSRTL